MADKPHCVPNLLLPADDETLAQGYWYCPALALGASVSGVWTDQEPSLPRPPPEPSLPPPPQEPSLPRPPPLLPASMAEECGPLSMTALPMTASVRPQAHRRGFSNGHEADLDSSEEEHKLPILPSPARIRRNLHREFGAGEHEDASDEELALPFSPLSPRPHSSSSTPMSTPRSRTPRASSGRATPSDRCSSGRGTPLPSEPLLWYENSSPASPVRQHTGGPLTGAVLLVACSYKSIPVDNPALARLELTSVRTEADDAQREISDAHARGLTKLRCRRIDDPSLQHMCSELREHPETEVLLFLGHGDARLRPDGEPLPLFVSRDAGGKFVPEVNSHHAIVCATKAAVTDGELCVALFNACESLELCRRLCLDEAIVPFIVCWKTIVHTTAAHIFGAAFAKALATSVRLKRAAIVKQAYLDAKNAVLAEQCTVKMLSGHSVMSQRFEFADPRQPRDAFPPGVSGPTPVGVPVLLIHGEPEVVG